MRPFVLKAAATALTMATTVASAIFVTSHIKNPGAPLQPSVLTTSQGALIVGPSVQPTDVEPITSTYAS
jgi:hypothetical protein